MEDESPAKVRGNHKFSRHEPTAPVDGTDDHQEDGDYKDVDKKQAPAKKSRDAKAKTTARASARAGSTAAAKAAAPNETAPAKDSEKKLPPKAPSRGRKKAVKEVEVIVLSEEDDDDAFSVDPIQEDCPAYVPNETATITSSPHLQEMPIILSDDFMTTLMSPATHWASATGIMIHDMQHMVPTPSGFDALIRFFSRGPCYQQISFPDPD